MKKLFTIMLVAGALAGCAVKDTNTPLPSTVEPNTATVAPRSTVTKVVGTTGMKSLQRALAARGYYGGKIDGVDGPQTRNAVAHFQQNMGVVPVTGSVDEQTWSALGLSQ